MTSPTLLITAAGTGVGWAYALTLSQQFPEARLITADTNTAAWCSAAQLSSRHLQWAAFEAGPAYLEQLKALIAAEGVTHYLPIIDPEIDFAARHREQLGAELLAPGAAFTALALAKDRYFAALTALGIDSPRTLSRADIAAGRTGFAKLPASFGGRGTWRIDSASQLDTLPADAFVQEGLGGPEFTADCFPLGPGDEAGEVFVSVRERVETKSGVCTKARIAPHAGMQAIARQLVAGLGLTSPFCFQAMADGPGSGRLAVTDLNPRLGAGTLMSAANGGDFFGAHLARAFGQPWRERLQRHHERCAVTRQYVELLSAE
jgi:carbamoyl-phosphate synthase large subunit